MIIRHMQVFIEQFRFAIEHFIYCSDDSVIIAPPLAAPCPEDNASGI